MFPVCCTSGDALDVLAREVSQKKRTVSDVQVRRWVKVLPFKFQPGPRKTCEKAARAVTSMLGSSAEFLDPADDMPVFENSLVEEDAPCDLWELTFRNDREPSVLQRLQKHCQAYGLAVPSDVHSVQKLLSEALTKLNFANKDGASLWDLKKENKSDKAEREASLKALQDKLQESEHYVNDLEHDEDRFRELASEL